MKSRIMNNHVPWVLGLLVLSLGACASPDSMRVALEPAKAETMPPDPPPKAETSASKPASPCPANKGTSYEGRVTYEGLLGYTKGAQLMINDKAKGAVILRLPRGPERRAWVGKMGRATGDLCVYTCGPGEQCLLSGEIKYLVNVEIQATP